MIRFYEEKDYSYVLKLFKEFKIEIDLKSNPFYKCFVYEDDIIKGCLVFEKIYERVELDYIVVDNNYRRCGIGSKLIDYLVDYCMNNNISNITLEVNENNIAAQDLYKKKDFCVVSKRDGYYNGSDGLFMMRKFDNDE